MRKGFDRSAEAEERPGESLSCEEAVAEASRALRSRRGLSEWEVFLEEERELVIEVKEGRVESLVSARTQGLAIRALSRERLGFSFTNQLTLSSLREAADRALENSKLTPPRPGFSFPAVSPEPLGIESELWDSRAREVPREDKIKRALSLERSALELDPRVRRVHSAEFEEGFHQVWLQNSHGLFAYGRVTLFSGSLEAVAEEKGEAQAAAEFETLHHYDKLDPERLGRSAAERALAMLGAGPVPAGSMPVVLSPRAAAGLIAILAPAVFADAVEKGRSWLGPRRGERVASPKITIVDNGGFAEGPAAFAFDDEGTRSRRTVVIDEGALAGFLYDAYYGKKTGHCSTGNGKRASYVSPPAVDATNWMLMAGGQSESDLVGQLERGLYLTEFLGLHTADPVSGEFSLGAQGFLVKQGHFDRPVTGIAIAGTVERLLSGVRGVADNLVFTGDAAAPSILIEELDVSGVEMR